MNGEPEDDDPPLMHAVPMEIDEGEVAIVLVAYADASTGRHSGYSIEVLEPEGQRVAGSLAWAQILMTLQAVILEMRIDAGGGERMH